MKKTFVLLSSLLLLYLGFSQEHTAMSAENLQVTVSSFDTHLSWEAEALPEDGYVRVERAENDEGFELIECVAADEIRQINGQYQFTDANARFLIGPVVRYRLSWIDDQGYFHESAQALVNIDPHYY